MKNEERLMQHLKDVDEKPKENSKITRLINEGIKRGKVYLATDWHFYTKYQGERRSEKFEDGKVHKRYNYETVVNAIKDTLTEKDLLIFLGDMVDGEFEEKDKWKLKFLLKEIIPCKCIMVRGNNDLFPDSFYTNECGFAAVVDDFVWGDILFSHVPQSHDYDMNIHGHIHNSMNYYTPYNKHIDVAYCGGRIKPVELMEVIHKQPKYSKEIHECPEHFNEAAYIFEDLYP